MTARTRFRLTRSAAALALFATLATQPAAQARPCVDERFEGANYVVCTVDPGASDLRLFWKNAEGQSYRSFSNVAKAVSGQGRELVFAINAGMYRRDFSPVGLYVEAGRELQPADTTVIEGPPRQVPNFYKRPNGVFFLAAAGAGVLTTDAFLRTRPDVRFATQSGPMLVIESKLHAAFIPGSTDRTRRSGVGVCKGGEVRFAISDGGVNFDTFARLFRDRLGCPNALFLDGGRGAGLYLPETGRNDGSWYGGFGPIFGLVK